MDDTASAYGPYTDSGAESPATTPPAPGASTSPAPETVSTAPATAPTIAPERTDQTLNNLPSAPPQSWASKTYHGILAALGGAHDTVLSRDPQTGAMVVTQHTAQPGEQWKRIISGALTGFAGAQAAGTQGPGGAMRGLAGGIQAGAQRAQQNYNQARNEADEDFKIQQQTATDNANRSMQAHQIAASTFQLQQFHKKADQEDMDRLNTYNQMVHDGGPGTTDLGTFKNPSEIYKFAAQYRQAHDIHAEGRVFVMPDYDADGNRTGLRAAFVTNDWLNSKTTKDYKFTYQEPNDKGELEDKVGVIPAGTPNSVVMPFMQATAAAKNKKDLDQAMSDMKVELAESKEKLSAAEIAKDDAQAALANAKAAAEGQNVNWGPGGDKGFNSWHDKNVTPALQGERIYRMSSDIYNERAAAKAKGQKWSGAGSKSVQMLSNHIAGTFGNVKGARITKDLIEKHLGARSVSDSLQTAVQKLYDGDQLSDSQWDAFFSMIGENRNETWRNVLDDAQSLGRPLDYIAFPQDLRDRWGLGPGRVGPPQTTPPGTPPGIEEPLAPARPMPQGQTNVGGVPVTVHGNVPSSAVTPPAAATGKKVSLAAAKQLPQNKGKTDDQIKADIQSHGHEVAP